MSAHEFMSSLTTHHLYYVVPVGFDQALIAKGIKSPSAITIAKLLFGKAYMRFQQYSGSISTIGCRVSNSSIQKETGVSINSVKAALKSLESAGIIEATDTDKRGTFYALEKMVDLAADHALEQKFTTSKNDKKPQPYPANTQMHTSVSPREMNIPKSDSEAAPLPHLEKLKKIEKQLQDLKKRERSILGNTPSPIPPTGMLKILSSNPELRKIICKINELERKKATLTHHSTHPPLPARRTENEGVPHSSDPVNKKRSRASSTQQPHPKKLPRNHIKFMLKQLKEIGVTNPKETACEILWALENGWYALSDCTKTWKPFHALSSALKLVKQGRWRTPSGCEPWKLANRINFATAQ